MKRRITRNALLGALVSLPLGLLTLTGCGPNLDPQEVARHLAALSQETFTAELVSAAAEELSPASQNFLDGVNAALDDVRDVESARAARSALVIVADRIFGISRPLASLDLAPSESARKSAARRLESIDAWSRYKANLKRLESSPEIAVHVSEPLAEMVIFFERQSGAI